MLWGDPVQIQQVLVNLVRNAFEVARSVATAESDSGYSDQDGRATAALSSRVSDNGEGIPPDRLGPDF